MSTILDYAFINKIENKFGNSEKIETINQATENVTDYLTAIYKILNLNYPKFYKMDNLSKNGYLLSEIVVKNNQEITNRKDVSVVAINKISSLETDINYQKTISDSENFYPAPSLFVYTLPNIVTGEICIKHKFMGESSFYVSKEFNATEIFNITNDIFLSTQSNYVLIGWLNSVDFYPTSIMFLVSKDTIANKMEFTVENILKQKKDLGVF